MQHFEMLCFVLAYNPKMTKKTHFDNQMVYVGMFVVSKLLHNTMICQSKRFLFEFVVIA